MTYRRRSRIPEQRENASAGFEERVKYREQDTIDVVVDEFKHQRARESGETYEQKNDACFEG